MPDGLTEETIAADASGCGAGLPPNLFPGAEDGQAHHILRQTRQFFEATSDAIIFLDREYRFTFLNRRAKELLAGIDELLGKNLFESFPAAVYEGSPYVENYRRSMEERVATHFEAFYPEPLNLWFRVHSYPSDDGIIIYFQDFTDERASHAALLGKQEEAERQRNEIETVYRTAPIGLALFDPVEFRYLRLNNRQAAFFGLPPEALLGRTVTEMAPIEGLQELFDQVAAGGQVLNYPLEGELVSDPGEHRYWTVNYFPVFAADGTVQAISAASLEITAQKRAEQALIQNEKLAAVGRLASSIAHEINNPLESLTNLIYLAQRSGSLDEARDHLTVAERELRRAAAITNQTLRFHRQSTSPCAVTYDDLMESVLSIHHGRLVNARIAVSERKRTDGAVSCYEGEIRQVLNNLVGNAIDAMAMGGRLLLRSRVGTDWRTGRRGFLLTVADDGPGMSAETLHKAFEPFFTTKGLTGTGLGLWISTEIVTRHGGRLMVRSSQRQDHHGTVFVMFLPTEPVAR